MFGGGAAGTMTLDELVVLEKHLEIWICNIRSTKVRMNILCIDQFYLSIY
jgi:hypothetical protein